MARAGHSWAYRAYRVKAVVPGQAKGEDKLRPYKVKDRRKGEHEVRPYRNRWNIASTVCCVNAKKNPAGRTPSRIAMTVSGVSTATSRPSTSGNGLYSTFSGPKK